jgi:WD40 repeat protein
MMLGIDGGMDSRFPGGWARGLVAVVCLYALLGLGPGRAFAQYQVREPNHPILVVNPEGHSAPVRALVFSPDGTRLLSAGSDKIVNVWDLRQGGARPARTLRPVIWRGLRGVIYAMALSPQEVEGQRTLALAGFGVMGTDGNISLYHFPGRNQFPTGDIVAQLSAGAAKLDPRESEGHFGAVTDLQFSPRGDLLASASHDRTVRIWDVQARRTIAVLDRHGAVVNKLAFTPDGQRLVTGTDVGVIRLWDVIRREILKTMLAVPVQGATPTSQAITAMAISPDGRWLVVGRENGWLMRFDAADLGHPTYLPTNGEQGTVLALAFSHDSNRLAVSLASHLTVSPSERPRVDYDIELRSMPGGAIERALFSAGPGARNPALSNLAYACAFSPNDRYLAVAGGDSHGVYVVDLGAQGMPHVELRGQGRSIWEVAFGADSRSVAYSRRPSTGPGAPQFDEAFDLAAREFKAPGPAPLVRAQTVWEGWSVRAVDLYHLEIINPQGAVLHRLTLERESDRRWWVYGFIPPAVPEHSRKLLAVGCDAGLVALYDVETGNRVRELVGHTDKVYALAPSPDGRWLATGSSDQTIRLWRLVDRDRYPRLGATFGRTPEGRRVVTQVEPRSFAEAMGLRERDVIDGYTIDNKLQNLDAAPDRIDDEPPGHRYVFTVPRDGQPTLLETTKRDSPALSLFPALNREWILWMPDGYYDTSIAGDRRHLGWHLNRQLPNRLDQPTDFVPVDRYERRFHHPGVLARLLETGSALEAIRALPPGPDGAGAPRQLAPPPVVRLSEPVVPPDRPLEVGDPNRPLRLQVTNAVPGLIRAVRVLIDGRLAQALPPYDPPQPEVNPQIPLTLDPGHHQVNVLAVNDQGIEGSASFEVVLKAPPTRTPRLVVLSFGAERFPLELPSVEFAPRDAKELGSFLSAPGGRPRFEKREALVFDDPKEATAARITEALTWLKTEHDQGRLGRGDTVFVVLESHFLEYDKRGHLVGTDIGETAPPIPGLSADHLAEQLGLLTASGCRVMLLTDLLHRPLSRPKRDAFKAWVRELYKNRGVIVFVASKDAPSDPRKEYRAFAEAVLTSLDVRSQFRLRTNPSGVVTLRDFKDTVTNRVRELVKDQQAEGYPPDKLTEGIAIFEPQADVR